MGGLLWRLRLQHDGSVRKRNKREGKEGLGPGPCWRAREAKEIDLGEFQASLVRTSRATKRNPVLGWREENIVFSSIFLGEVLCWG